MSKIRTGDPLPTFRAQLYAGGELTNDDLNEQPTWLAFFRYAACPLCNLRVRDILKRHDADSARGLRFIAIFQSGPASVGQYVGKNGLPFDVVTDPEQRLYETFGVGRSVLGIVNPLNGAGLFRAMANGIRPGLPDGPIDRIPADFLIRPGGVVDDAYYGDRIGAHIPLGRVDAFLDRCAS